METSIRPFRLRTRDAQALARLEARCFPYQPWNESTFAIALSRPAFTAFGLPGPGGLSAYCTAHGGFTFRCEEYGHNVSIFSLT